MRIAYISYEHPFGIDGGGIGTYIGIISEVMSEKNHCVEVFSGSRDAVAQIRNINNYKLHLIPTKSKNSFKDDVLEYFSKIHDHKPFDIIETAEYSADGLNIKKKFMDLPMVVRLHTPSYIVKSLNDNNNSLKQRLRFIIGALLRFRKVTLFWKYIKENDEEFEIFNLADSISSPSTKLIERIQKEWSTTRNIELIPNPFIIRKKLSQIKFNEEYITIAFIGKLEKRKGILDLVDSIPRILQYNPKIKFLFVGSPSLSPINGMDMETYIKKKLIKNKNSIEFLGFVNHEKIMSILERSRICIFPSIWENFPYTCLEAMAAKKAVIGTYSGGMAEIIDHNVNGFLIPPHSPRSIVKTILYLAKNPHLIDQIGERAHDKILYAYNKHLIGDMTENLYTRTLRNFG
ncbi:MAG: glycosyltransferase family 1 protein [Pedobacter sp.]|nr:MAG: glycosyltransferase family 1 protein [Pedobacter sp.]